MFKKHADTQLIFGIRSLTILAVLIHLGMTQEVFPGYTLFNPTGPQDDDLFETYLIDTDEQVINIWQHVNPPHLNPYLLPDSTLLYPNKIPNPIFGYLGGGGSIQRLAWDGTVLWEIQLADETTMQHHDAHYMPNGNILAICWDRHTAEEGYALGREVIENAISEMWSVKIIEIEPIGADSSNIVWEWRMWDHLVQDVDPELPNYGIISEHPELLNINYGEVGIELGPANADWHHTNAIDYNEELDQIVISCRKFSEVYIIDHSTTTAEAASHSGGNSGRGGDFLYRWGNPTVYHRGTQDDRLLFLQHGVNWVDEGILGAGNLLIFNNGRANGVSAVFEINPPLLESGLYSIDDELPFGPSEPFWEYSEDIYSPTQSGVYRLPNGNTLITVSYQLRIVEISPEEEVLWDYQWPEYAVHLARALKYPLDYLESSPPFLLGDLTGDQAVNIHDVVELVSVIINMSDYTPAGDLDENGAINVQDVVILVEMILQE